MAALPLNTFAAVSNSSSKVLSGNSGRTNATFTNDSNVNLYLSLGVAAIVGSGILLAPGGMFNLSDIANLSKIWTGDIFAIASSAGSNNLAIVEQYN